MLDFLVRQQVLPNQLCLGKEVRLIISLLFSEISNKSNYLMNNNIFDKL